MKKLLVLGLCTSLVLSGCGSVDGDIPEEPGSDVDVSTVENSGMEGVSGADSGADSVVDSDGGDTGTVAENKPNTGDLGVQYSGGSGLYVDLAVSLGYGSDVTVEVSVVADADTVYVQGSAVSLNPEVVIPEDSVMAWLQFDEIMGADAYVWDMYEEAWYHEAIAEDIQSYLGVESVVLPDWVEFDANGEYSADITLLQLLDLFDDSLKEQFGDLDLDALEEFAAYLDIKIHASAVKDLSTGYLKSVNITVDKFEIEDMQIDGLYLGVVVNEFSLSHAQFDIPEDVVSSAYENMWDVAIVTGIRTDSIGAVGLGVTVPVSYVDIYQMLDKSVDNEDVLNCMADFINYYSFDEFYQVVGRWDNLDSATMQAVAYLCWLGVVDYEECISAGADEVILRTLCAGEFDGND